MPISPYLKKVIIELVHRNLKEKSLEEVIKICDTTNDQIFLQDLEALLPLDAQDRYEVILSRISNLNIDANALVITRTISAMWKANLQDSHHFRKGLKGYILDPETLEQYSFFVRGARFTRPTSTIRIILSQIPYQLIVVDKKRWKVIAIDKKNPLDLDEFALGDYHAQFIHELFMSSDMKEIYMEVERFEDYTIKRKQKS